MTKTEFRRAALRRLRALPAQSRYIADKQINQQLGRLMRASKASTVMLYIPLAIEADIRPLIARLRRAGVTVWVPFMEGESFRLVKYRLPLEHKKYGVKEPKFSKQFRKKRIDISIVPIIGTDASMRRVGFGKGMYDRFFMRERRWIEEVVFVQRVLCYSQEIVTDDHDVGADRLVTARRS